MFGKTNALYSCWILFLVAMWSGWPSQAYADLQVSFTKEATSFSIGEEGTWGVTITNPDPDDVTTDLVVTLPDDFKAVSYGTGAYSHPTITWSSLVIPGNGGTHVENFTAGPSYGAANGNWMSASVGAASADSSSIEVKYPALNITKTPRTQDVHLGDSISWTITVENPGTGNIVNGVNLTDTLGAGFGFLSIAGPNAPADLDNLWNTGSISAGDSVEYTVNANVVDCDPSELTNKIEGYYTDGDNTCATREATAAVSIEVRKPDIDITVTPPATISYCGPNSTTITVDNTNGSGPAKGFKLKVGNLLDDWAVTNVSGTTWDADTSQFTVGDIAAGDSASFSFDIGPSGSPCHQGNYYGGQRPEFLTFQPIYADECENAYAPPYIGPMDFSVDSSTVSYFEVSKTGPRSADRGETGLNYTLTVRYVAPAGTGDATVDIIDDYPDSAQTGLTEGFVVTGTAGGTDDGGTITWDSVSFSPGDTWQETITMDAPTDECAPGNDYPDTLSLDTTGVTDCLNCDILIIGNTDDNGSPTSSASANTFINQPDDPAVVSSSKGVDYIDSPSGVDAAEVCTNIQYTTCFTFAGTAPASWDGIIFNDEMPHQSYVSVDEVKANDTVYDSSCYVITNTSPLEIDLSSLDGCGAPAPSSGAKLCVTFTLHADETVCEFVDFSGIYIPSQSSGCGGDNDFDQGVMVAIGQSAFDLGTTNSPSSIDTCEIKQFRIDFNNSGQCASAYWDLYDTSVNVDTHNHYTLITGDAGHPVAFHNMQDPDGNNVSAFDPVGNGDGNYTWNLSDIRHHTDRQVGGPQPYITFYMKRDCDDSPGTEGWDVSAEFNNRCENDSGSIHRSAGNTPGGKILLLRSADLLLSMSPSKFTTYSAYPEFRVAITNAGSGAANSTDYKVDFGDGLQYWDYSLVSGDGPDSVNGSQGDSTLTFHWDNLDPNEKIVFKITGHVVACDKLTVDGTLTWCDLVCQTKTAHSEVLLPRSDVIIVKHETESLDYCNDRSATFHIKARNTGDADVFHLHMLEQLSSGLSYVANSAQYSITSSHGNTSGSLEPSINGQELDWDLSNKLPTNGDGEYAFAPDGEAEITFEVEIINCSAAQNYAASDKKASAKAKYDKLCEASTITPGSVSAGYIGITSQVDPHVSVAKQGKNITKGTGWKSGEVDADVGDIIEWQVTYTSNGDYYAKDVIISDTLPSNVTYVPGSFSSDCGSCTDMNYFNPPGSGCDIGDMAVSSSCIVTFRTAVNLCTDDPTTNTAQAVYGCCSQNPMQKTSTNSVDLRTEPDFSNGQVSLSHNNWTTCGGQVTITITNEGGTATNQNITDTLPAGYTFDDLGACTIAAANTPSGVTHNSFNCTGVSGNIPIWDSSNIDFVAPDETITITFRTKMDGSSYCDTTKDNDTNDPDINVPDGTNAVTFTYQDSCNNSHNVNDSDTINPTQPDIDITKTPIQQTVPEGGTASWTITLTNEGDAPANNITLTDVLGNGFSSPSDNQSGSWAGNAATWNIVGPIAAGSTWTVTVQATVGSGSLRNHATVEGICKDQGGSDICTYAHDETDAYTAAFEMEKTVDKDTANVGEELTYNIVTRFSNTDEFKEVTIIDTLPANTTFVSAAQNGGDFAVDPGQSGQVLTWDLGDFNGPKEFNYLVKIRINNAAGNNSGSVLTNNVAADFSIDFDGDEPSDATFHKTDSADTTVTEPKLILAKEIEPNTGNAGDTVTITLTVTNNGDGPVYNITLADFPNDTDNDGDVDGDDSMVCDCDSIAEDTTPSGFSYSKPGSHPGCKVTYTSDGDTAIPVGESRTFKFTAEVCSDVVTGSSYTDKAEVDGWSLPPSDSESENTVYDRRTMDEDTDNLTIGQAGVSSKEIVSTSEDSTDPGDANKNNNPPVAIGEVIDYKIPYTFVGGVTRNVTIVDEIPNGLGYIANTAKLDRSSNDITCANNPGNINSSTLGNPVSVILDTSTSDELRLALGDVTNSSSGTKVYILTLKMVVKNTSGNDAGADFINRGRVDFEDANSNSQSVSSGDVSAHVAEPAPTIDKTASPTAGDAGDTITFTLEIYNNVSGANAASAFNWAFHDPLPIEYENAQVINVDTGATGATVTASFTGNTLNGDIDQLDPGEHVTVTYTADLKSDVEYGETITNTATYIATSLPGIHGTGDVTPGDPGSETGERNGSGGVNDLFGQNSATVSINEPSIGKDTVNPQSHYAIGEMPSFQITVGVPEGTSKDFVVTDQLPDGLSFVSGTLSVTMPSGATSSHDDDGNGELEESDVSFFSYNTANAKSTFDFGTITVPNAGNIVIAYQAQVDNQTGNQDGATLTNTATLTYDDPDNPGETIIRGPTENQNPVQVGEPNLYMEKEITAGATGSDAGDTVSWRITIQNTGHTTAYQVEWNNVLPDGLHQISNAHLTTAGGNVYLNDTITAVTGSYLHIRTTINTNDTLDLADTASGDASDTVQIDPSSSVTITFDSVLMDTVTQGQVLNNETDATYTSLVDGGRDGSDEGDDDTDDRLDNYRESASQSLTVKSQMAIDKNLLNAPDDRFTIGEELTYQVRISIMEGITQSVTVADTLPDYLSYISSQVINGNAGIIHSYSGSPSQNGQEFTFDFGNIQNHGDSDNTNDYVDVEITARADNMAENQDGEVRKNNVCVEYDSNHLDYDHDAGTPEIDGFPITITEPDLEVGKTANPNEQSLGDMVTFTINISHTGNSNADAYDVVADDTLPGGLTYVDCTLPDADVTVNGQDLEFKIASITLNDAGKEFTYRARVDADATVGQPLQNDMHLTWKSLVGADGTEHGGRTGDDCGQANPLNDYCDDDQAQMTPTTAAFIDTTKTVEDINSGDVQPGDILEYTITLHNTNGAVTGAGFIDTIPASTTYVGGSLTTTKGTTDDSGAPDLVCDVGDVASDETITITFRVTVDAGTPEGTVISNQGSVDSDQTVPEPTDEDGNDWNGDQPTEVTVGGTSQQSGLYCWKFVEWTTDADSSKDITPGDIMTYWVVFENTGQDQLTGVSFTDTIPEGLTYNSSSEASDGTLTITDADVSLTGMMVDVDNFEYIRFNVMVDSWATPPDSKTYTNQGTADSDQTDSVPSDGNGDFTDGNQPTQFDAVCSGGSGSPSLQIDKVWELYQDNNRDGQVNPGEVLRYTIYIQNVGSAPATDVHLEDSAPEYTSIITDSATTSEGIVVSEDPVSINVGILNPGEIATIQFKVVLDDIISTDTEIHNVATVNVSGGISETVQADTSVVSSPNFFDPPNVFKTVDANNFSVLRYTAVLINSGNAPAEDVVYTDPIPDHTVYDPGTIILNGNSVDDVTGYDSVNERILVHIGTIQAGQSATISFSVRVNNGFTGIISNQGVVSGSNFPDEFTDDSATPDLNDPTQYKIPTPVGVPTLNELGMFVLSILLAVSALIVIRGSRGNKKNQLRKL